MRTIMSASMAKSGIEMKIPRQVATNADKDRRFINQGSEMANLNMYNRYNAGSSYLPSMSAVDMKKAEAITKCTEVPAVYTKVY